MEVAFFMKDSKKSARITLWITYFLMVLLVFFTVILPYGTTWYVEKMGRSERLATVVMLTCYPCVPLAVIALVSLMKFVKNILRGKTLEYDNIRNLKRLCICCIIAGLIMLAAGHFYMPFYIASFSAIFCGTVIKAFYDALMNGEHKSKNDDNYNKSEEEK